MPLNESIVEDAALTWFGELGHAVGHGPLLAPGEPAAELDSFADVVLAGRLREATRRLNPAIPEEALRKVLRVSAGLAGGGCEDCADACGVAVGNVGDSVSERVAMKRKFR